MKTQDSRPVNRDIIIAFVLLLLMSAGGGAWLAWRSTKPKPVAIQQPIPSQVQQSPISPIPPTTVPFNSTPVQKPGISTTKPTVVPPLVTKTIPPIKTAVTQLKPQVYWLKVTNNGEIVLVPQQVTVQAGVSSEATLKTVFNNLLNSSETSNLTSTIPPGTRLMSLQVNESGIYVNLSKEFARGGGSTSMIYRIAQVVYSASSLDPQAKIYLSVEGKLLDANNPLGGEGLILTEPLTRQQFAQDFSISPS